MSTTIRALQFTPFLPLQRPGVALSTGLLAGALLLAASAAPAQAGPEDGGLWRGEESSIILWSPDGANENGQQARSVPLLPDQRLTGSTAVRDGWVLTGEEDDDLALWRVPLDAAERLQDPAPWRLAWRGAWTLPTPLAASGAHLRRQPRAVSRDGELLGLAWLEGATVRTLAVRWAEWNDLEGTWGAPITVAAPAVGTQTALTAAVSADGTVVLAWSAFDGIDDEILWASHSPNEGSWSAPRSAFSDNSVPDIAPELSADGRLLAWSRFDLETDGYRLHIARRGDTGFLDLGPAAAAGSVLPTFEKPLDGSSMTGGETQRAAASSGESLVLYRSVADGGWAIARVAADGRILGRAATAAPDGGLGQRPAVLGVSTDGARLGWNLAPRTVGSTIDTATEVMNPTAKTSRSESQTSALAPWAAAGLEGDAP